MSRGVNKVIIVGNLGNDPDVRYMPSGGAVANLSIATTDQWKDKQTGENRDKTEWHRVVLFNRLGEIAGEYLRKGSQIYIEGKLQTRKWTDQQGVEKYTTEIVASEMQMLGGKPSSQSGAPPSAAQERPQQDGSSSGQSRPAAQNQTPGQRSGPAPDAFPDFDDDIPF